MMQVTAIRCTKRGRYSIDLDEEFACVLHADVFALSDLTTGSRVSPEKMAELQHASEQKLTRERALRLLGQRAYTEQGLYRKLCEKTDEQNAAETVARMVELGLLNDRDYAQRYAADCMTLKGFSVQRTMQELLRKGIDREIAQEVLETRKEDDPSYAIAQVIYRKYLHCLNDEKGYRRTVSALQRLGYRYGDIRTVIDNIQEDEDYYQQDD